MDIENRLSTKQKGDIVENRVSEIITLSSNGYLTCFSPNTDDDGIDLIINPKGAFSPIFLQVKGRFISNQKKMYIQNVNISTFRSDNKFLILFVLFNSSSLEVDTLWLVPSDVIESDAVYLQPGEKHKASYRFNASLKENKTKWHEFKVDKAKLGDVLKEKIEQLYK